MVEQDDLNEAARWADVAGWTSIWSPALRTKKGGASGGVAVFARRGIGIRDGCIATAHAHRLISAEIEVPGVNKFDLTSAYFRTGTGMTGVNAALLADLVQHRSATQRPGFVAGDFNNGAETVAATRICHLLDGSLCVPNLETCMAGVVHTTIDLVIAYGGFQHAVETTKAIRGANIKTHRPVQVTMMANQNI